MQPDEDRHWFVLRDLKRQYSKLPAYKQLEEAGVHVFTPLTPRIRITGGKRTRVVVPVIPDLLFAHSTRAELDPIVARTDTLQYRFRRGGKYCEPMTVPPVDMACFIAAVGSAPSVRYYQPSEVTPDMVGARIRLICDGPLDGYTGHLLKLRGTARRHLLVQLPGLLTAAVEVSPSYIQLL